MAGRKYYAVKTGRKTGIFESWEECKGSVDGFAGAVYKSFKELDEAERYLEDPTVKTGKLKEENNARQKSAEQKSEKVAGEKNAGQKDAEQQEKDGIMLAEPQDRPAPGRLLAYVDGSYDDSLKKYAFGCVFILPEGTIYTQYGNGDKEQALQHRNVTGEMLGAMYAVRTAMISGFTEVELRYDYEGIEKWVTGQWRSRTELTGKYAKAMREWRKNIKIYFTKVAAHSNVYYNEMADKMAKTGLREGNGTPAVKNLYEAETLL